MFGQDHKVDLEWVDYSGYDRNQPKMGLARFDSGTKRLIVDSVLQWDVPSGWTLEDATTVPVIYALVSHSAQSVANTVCFENATKITLLGVSSNFVAFFCSSFKKHKSCNKVDCCPK